MTRCDGLLSRSVRMMFCLMLVMAWSGASQAWAQQRPGPEGDLTPEQREEIRQELDRFFHVLRQVRRDLPRDTFDPQAILSSVGRDPADLFAWVRDQTHWVPYQGALRGPQGVLMDRLGNSVDRALLLGRMLQLAGHDTRLVRGELGEEEAQQRLEQVRPVPHAWLDNTNPEPQAGQEAMLAEYAEQFGMDPTEMRNSLLVATMKASRLAEETIQRAAEQTEMIAQMIDLPEQPEDRTPQIMEDLRDHWWVQYRQGEAWIDLDPLLPDAEPGQKLTEPAETFPLQGQYTRIPLESELVHEVHIRVIVERWKDGKLTTHEVLDHALRPAELYGARITLRNNPTGWPRDFNLFAGENPMDRLKEVALEQDNWVPVLQIHKTPVFKFGFNNAGEIEENPIRPPEAEVGRQIERGFGAAMGALRDDPEDEKAASHLTAQWVEYEIRAPGRPAKTIRRDTFDLIGPAARAAGEHEQLEINDALHATRALALLSEVELMPIGCWISPEVAMAIQMQGLLVQEHGIMQLLASDEQPAPNALTDVVNVPNRLLPLALARHKLSFHRGDVYLDRLNILSSFQIPVMGESGEVVASTGYDIIANDIAVRSGTRGDVFRIRLHQGVVDTNVEAALLEGDGPVVNTAETFQQALFHGDKWQLIKEPDNLKGIELSRSAQIIARGDLAAGHWLLMDPAGAVWWRVDPRTGSCLGMDSTGRGGAKEYQALLLSVAGTIVMTGYGLEKCMELPANRQSCCVMFVMMVGMGGLFLGGFLHYGLGLFVAVVSFFLFEELGKYCG